MRQLWKDGSLCMKINIYYGGRGVIDDPTLYVITKMADVFRELNVTVEQFNLYEQKNNITALAGSLKGADGLANFHEGRRIMSTNWTFVRAFYAVFQQCRIGVAGKRKGVRSSRRK